MKKSRRQRQRELRIKIFTVCTGTVLFLLILYLTGTLWSLVVKGRNCDHKTENAAQTSDQLEQMEVFADSEASLDETEEKDEMEILEEFAKKNGLTLEDYPESLIELLGKNSEAKDFVLNYPLKKDQTPTDDVDEIEDLDSIPLLMQWDQRWGYYEYGDEVLGLTGCGPTCLSMVAMYLLKDTRYTPLYMAKYSARNGYCVAGSGTSWLLMSEGAENLGLESVEVPLEESSVISYLERDMPIICIMGAGDFTDDGHFIVFTEMKDGKLVINDPNSRINSAKLWEFEDIKNQIHNMWAYEN